MIAPTYRETLTSAQAQARIRQLGARKVPGKSKAGRDVYLSKQGGKPTWILVKPHGQYKVLGYYQMERCPCEDD